MSSAAVSGPEGPGAAKGEAGDVPRPRAPIAAATPPGQLHHEVRSYQVSDVFKVLVLLRLINALCVRTFFQPDEFFQSLEPAWALAFGPDSGAWMTWEWEHQLRSSLHPALFGAFYLVAQRVMASVSYFPQFQALVLPDLPRVVQSLFAAAGDFYTWRLAEKVYGQGSNAAWAALWMTVLSPWQWYCATRTFSNSLEMTLTVAALYYWPWDIFADKKTSTDAPLKKSGVLTSLRISLLLAALAVVLRPTNLLIWLGIVNLALTWMTLDGQSTLDTEDFIVLLTETFVCGSSVLAISLVSDRLFFGEWTFPPYKWLNFNISQSLAVFYGSNPWHYYLLQGIPLLTTTFLPFALVGFCQSSLPSSGVSLLRSNSLKVLSFCVLSMVASLSLISHKEVRFIYPLLPILHVLAAEPISSFFTTPTTPKPTDSKPASTTTTTTQTYKLTRTPILAIILLLNVLLGGYLSLLHQRAPLAALSFLRQEYERLHPTHLSFDPPPAGERQPSTDELFALFLTPCHSTPWRSHLVHRRLRARALTCEPPLHTTPGSPERVAYLDEADRFYATPSEGGSFGVAFLDAEMWPVVEAGEGSGGRVRTGTQRGGEVPRYIVGFEGVEAVLEEFFTGPGRDMGIHLTRVWEGWNGFFNEDWRRKGLLVVWDTGVYPSVPEEEESVFRESL